MNNIIPQNQTLESLQAIQTGACGLDFAPQSKNPSEGEYVLSLFLQGTPKPKQGGNHAFIGGRLMRFQTKEVKQNFANLRALTCQQLAPNFKPFSVPVTVQNLLYIFPYRKADQNTKKKQEKVKQGLLIPHASKPDLDNLTKSLFDALKTVVFTDDAIVTEIEYCGKFYGPTPGIYIEIMPNKTEKKPLFFDEILSKIKAKNITF